jgi:F-type H+-transporting ATPase subunit b
VKVDWKNVVFQAVNFLVLVWILKRVLFGRVKEVIARRQAVVAGELAAAEAEKVKARVERKKAEDAARSAVVESERALEAARGAAEVEKRRLEELARRETEALVEDGRKRIALERDAATRALEQEATRLSASLAERLLGELDREATTRLLLERTLARLTALEPERLAALRRELGRGEITVATGSPLDDGTRARAAKLLGERLEVAPERVAFSTDPEVPVGAVIRFASSEATFTWHGALEQLAREVMSHGHAA